ncbi:MAG: hypothetical protein SWE60_23890 [Thermodesulfobacteriota bacterium]|nr:hypothetical protein [Thermodesulfobacteriota bacterium]
MGSRVLLLVALFLLAPSLFSCAFTPTTGVEGVPTLDAHPLLSLLKEEQDKIKSFRGMGKLRYTMGGKRQSTRVAWIGSPPADLRIETLGLWGQPSLTLLVKGATFYLHLPHEGRCVQAKATARNVSRLVSVPVPVEDLFVMLSGQVPVRPFERAEMAYVEAEGQWCLSLYRKWRRLVERIWTSGEGTVVNRIEVYEASGGPAYTAWFGRSQPEDSMIAQEIIVSGGEGASFSLEMERLSTNVEAPAGAYRLPVACGSHRDF